MIYVGLGRTFQPTAPSGPLTPSYESEIHFRIRDILNPCCCGWVTAPQPSPHFPGYWVFGVFFVAYLAHKEKIFLHPWGLPTNVFMESIFSPSWKLLESLWRGLREKADGWKGCVSLCLGLNS